MRKPFSPCQFDDGYAELIAIDRAFGGEIYDAIKSIPAFLRLISSEQFEKLFLQLRETELVGIGVEAAGFGLIILTTIFIAHTGIRNLLCNHKVWME